jgi:hypothetical protein
MWSERSYAQWFSSGIIQIAQARAKDARLADRAYTRDVSRRQAISSLQGLCMSFPTPPETLWTPLAERLESLPLVLAGPILRRVEPGFVTVWVALRAPRQVTLRVYQWNAATGDLTERLAGARHTVRLGERLHVVAVTARAANDAQALNPGQVYCFNLTFDDGAPDEDGNVTDLRSPGVLVANPDAASDVERLTYRGLPLPSFVLPATMLEQVRIFHGSCRKPHGVGRDALETLDDILAQSATDPLNRPQQLYLTGDQIYADDVAELLLAVLTDAAETLVGREELPSIPPGMRITAPGQRSWVVREMARFTTSTPQNHLLTRGEYLAMYLFTWSDALWPAALPTQEDVWRAYPEARPFDERERARRAAHWRLDERELADFRETLPHVRRALANIPTYMICDDHDVTDDWYLDGAWCANVLERPLGRRIIRNGLYAYALCQAWGNDPEQFDAPNGRVFLETVDRWRGGEQDIDKSEDAALLEEYLALPDDFPGRGTLPRGELALHWNFTVETPAYRMLVLDSRTRRVYDQPHAAPGLLSDEAMAEQIGDPASADARLTLLVSPTPALGVDVVEKVQLLSLDHYAYDRESWALNRRVYQAFLRRLARFGRILILSGDVHYGFGSTMEYWEQTGSELRGAATIINFTSSSFKNVASGVQKALLTVAYPHLFHLLSRGRMPPIDLFAWDEGTPGNANALAAATRAVQRGVLAVWWSAPRVATLLRSPTALMLPAHGWPAHAFDKCPPARRMRLRYLRDVFKPAHEEEHAGLPEWTEAALDEISATHHQHVRETVASLTGEAPLGVDKALEAARVLESGEYSHPVRLGVAQRLLELAQTVLKRDRLLPELQARLSAGIGHLLRTALAHPELWTRVWSDGGLHIVGDTNIGEIRFEKSGEDGDSGYDAVQRLWWRPRGTQGAADNPQPATEYRASLTAPAVEDAPLLP